MEKVIKECSETGRVLFNSSVQHKGKYGGCADVPDKTIDNDVYYDKPCLPSKELCRRHRASLVSFYQPMLNKRDSYTDGAWLDLIITVRGAIKNHNEKYPKDVIVLAERKGKPVLLYSN